MTTAPPPLRDVQARYGRRALTAAVVIALAFWVLGYPAVCKGVILGTLFSILNFVLLGAFLPHRLGLTRNRAVLAALGTRLIRFTVLAIPIALAVRLEQFDLTAVVAGIFAIPLVLLGDHAGALWRG